MKKATFMLLGLLLLPVTIFGATTTPQVKNQTTTVSATLAPVATTTAKTPVVVVPVKIVAPVVATTTPIVTQTTTKSAIIVKDINPSKPLIVEAKDANPYSVNESVRNFFNHLDDVQKILVKFRTDLTIAKKTADDSITALKETKAKGTNAEITTKTIELAKAHVESINNVKKIAFYSDKIAPLYVQALEAAKVDVINGLFKRASLYMGEIPSVKCNINLDQQLVDADKKIQDGYAKLLDLMSKNLLGVDKNGFFVKYDTSGKQVDFEITEVYTKQDGDVYLDVPFFAQAPGGGWYDSCQSTACEEAGLVQAHIYFNKVDYKDPFKAYTDDDMLQRYAIRQILGMCDYEYQNYNSHLYHDTSAKMTAELWQNYYKHNYNIIENPIIDVIKYGLRAGYIYATPIDGSKILTVPPYRNPKNIPVHTVLIVGYNDKRNEFIINDPGSWTGDGARFNQNDFMSAIRDYPSGHNEKITSDEKRIVELKP